MAASDIPMSEWQMDFFQAHLIWLSSSFSFYGEILAFCLFVCLGVLFVCSETGFHYVDLTGLELTK